MKMGARAIVEGNMMRFLNLHKIRLEFEGILRKINVNLNFVKANSSHQFHFFISHHAATPVCKMQRNSWRHYFLYSSADSFDNFRGK